MIRLEHITKSYKTQYMETQALKDISLTIPDGEFVAIMGPSGAGKSTLLHILGIMDLADSGTYMLDDVCVTGKKRRELDKLRQENMAFVFQNFALMKERSVYENVELPLIARKEKASVRRKKVQEQLERLGIAELSRKKASQISGGQQQRVGIARALVSGAKYVLADEPTGALDGATGMEVLKLLQEIAEQGKTVIMVTHNPELAAGADRIIRITDGIVDGSTADIAE